MNTETINTLKELLVPVAEKIGQTAEWGWAVVIKQMYVEAVLGLLLAIFGLVILLTAIYITKKGWQWIQDETDGGALLLWMFGVFPIAMIFIGFNTAITHFINPEFYAIEFFIGLIK